MQSFYSVFSLVASAGLGAVGGRKKHSRGRWLKVMTILEEAAVEAETSQLSSFANAVKVGSSLNWWWPAKFIKLFFFFKINNPPEWQITFGNNSIVILSSSRSNGEKRNLSTNCFTSMPFADIESFKELSSDFNYWGINPKNDGGVGPDLHKYKWDFKKCLCSFLSGFISNYLN